MKAARSRKTRAVPAENPEEQRASNTAKAEALTTSALRQEIDRLVTQNAIEMVDATIEHVKSGQYQALKYLFEMVGLYPASLEEESPEDDSLAKILLERLGISDKSGSNGAGNEMASQLNAVE